MAPAVLISEPVLLKEFDFSEHHCICHGKNRNIIKHDLLWLHTGFIIKIGVQDMKVFKQKSFLIHITTDLQTMVMYC